MVSVGVSKLGCTELFFVEPGVKINGAYYRDVLLTQKLLPSLGRYQGMSSCFSRTVLQHTVLVRVTSRDAPNFISPEQWPPNSPDLNPVDYKIWATMQQHVYQTKIRNMG